MLTTTSHDSVFLRADNSLIDMNYITSFTGMTDRGFYKLISEDSSSRADPAAGIKAKCHSRYSNESKNHGGRSMKRVVIPVRWQCSTCQRWYCGAVPWCWFPVNLPASPPVSRHFVILTDSSFLSYCQSQLFASNRTCVDASAPT